ncbi:MAG: hypothetical protein AAGG56_18055 [Pseudomonadota bacterium]
MISRLACVLSLLFAPFWALATESQAVEEAPFLEGAEDIPLEEWTAMAMGKTLVYRIDGQLWALEYYYPGTNYVTLQLHDGRCMSGTWDYSDSVYCFHWDSDGTACFRHARVGDEILVIETPSDDRIPLIQHMAAVTDAPLTCEAPIS